MNDKVKKITLRDSDLRQEDLIVSMSTSRNGLWIERRDDETATLLSRCEAARLHRWLTRYLRQTKRYER